MKISFTLVAGFAGLVLIAVGLGVFVIYGTMTLTAAGLLWPGLMLVLFLLYVRFNEIKKLLAKKSSRYGANMVVMVIVFAAVVIFMAILGHAHKKRIDLTKTGRFTLSSQTKKILKALDTPVKAVAFYRSESGTMHARQRQTMRDLLDEYSSFSENFTFTFIDPDRKPGLASKYGVSEYRIVLLMSGGKQVKVANEKEEKMTNGLIKLLRKEKKVVYFVKGHGEKDITSKSKDGYNAALQAMIDENYTVRELLLLRVDEIPDDASVLVLASPRRDLDKSELDKLDRYYKRGGALLVEIDPGHPPGFQTWLGQYGFKVQTDVIIDQQSQLYGASHLTPVVYAYHKKHPLTEGFTLASYFPIANSVYIDEDKSKGRYELALTGPNSWTEVDKDQLESGQAEYNEEREKRGPIPVMSVTTIAVKGEEDKEGAKIDRYGKMILIGDSDFADNTNINLAGNGDLFLNSISWLAEEANLIAVRAKKSIITPVVLTVAQGRAIFWIPVVMIPSVVLMAGISIYSRRKWFR
ncbi:MAG: GldG family protein [Nitrospinota bacterium]